MLKSKQSQNAAILADLKRGIRITPLDALGNYGCFRLSARIYDLTREGHNIATKLVSANGKHWAEYHLVRGRK